MDHLNREIDLILEQSLDEGLTGFKTSQFDKYKHKHAQPDRATPDDADTIAPPPKPKPEPKPDTGPKIKGSPTEEQGKYLVPGTGEGHLRPAPGRKWKNDVPVGDQSDWDTVPIPGYSPDPADFPEDEDTEEITKEGLTLNEDKLAPIVIDFTQLREQKLNESFLAMFGGWVERILSAMFGDINIPVSVRGNKREVESFAKALGGEKAYLQSARSHGLDHPMTYKNKAKLDNAVKGFEKDTGLKWPFK